MILKPGTELQKLHIYMTKTDEINKNANAIIDKGCRELEDETKRVEPNHSSNLQIGFTKFKQQTTT